MRDLISKILTWLLKFFDRSAQQKPDLEHAHPQPSDFFTRNVQVEKTPASVDVLPQHFIRVVYKGVLHWTLFKCPCGCGDVISLPMSHPHNPFWTLHIGATGKPSLSPSVWRNKGCMSHFWVRDGQIDWCGDTGRAPWRVRPDLYKEPK